MLDALLEYYKAQKELKKKELKYLDVIILDLENSSNAIKELSKNFKKEKDVK